MQDYHKYSPCVILPKEAKQPQKQISHLQPNPKIIKSDTLSPDQSYVFGLLLINISLNSTIKGQAHQPTKHQPTPSEISDFSCHFACGSTLPKLINHSPQPTFTQPQTLPSFFYIFTTYKCFLISHCWGRFFAHSHVSPIGSVTLLSPDLFQGVQPGTRHWATQTNGFQCIFRSTKQMKPKILES